MSGATDLLSALFPEWPEGIFSEVRAFHTTEKDVEGKPKVVRQWVRSAAGLLAAAARLSPTHECYFGVNPRRGHNGTKNAVAYVGALHVDMDVEAGEALEKLAAFPLQPSAIVFSGFGVHVYWLMREPYGIDSPEDLARIERLNRGLAHALGGDTGAWDVSRVLRIPGTISHKRGAAVELLEFHPDRRYNPSDFEEYGLDLPPEGERATFSEADIDAEAAMGKAEGRELQWQGRLGFLTGSTPAIERHHGVIGELGERFLWYRLETPHQDREDVAGVALEDSGQESQMREEIAQAFLDVIGDLSPDQVAAVTCDDAITTEAGDRGPPFG